MKNAKWLVLSLMVFVLAVSACVPTGAVNQPEGETMQTLFVGPFWQPCVGVGPMLCMQVKDSQDGEWRNFYERIVGFEFEPGKQYELQVRQEKVENPPADASSLRWTLVKIVSQSEVETPQMDLTGTRWQLASLSGTAPAADSSPTLEFPEAGQLAGNAGCNSYFGSYELNGVSFQSGALGATKMACPEALMTQETNFFQALESMRYLQMQDGKLLLVSPDKTYLEFVALAS